jgi:hypothetical protein
MAYNTKKMGRREKGIKRKRVLNFKKNNRKGINLNKHHGANKEMLLKIAVAPITFRPSPHAATCKSANLRKPVSKY